MTHSLEKYMSFSEGLDNYAIVTNNIALHTISFNITKGNNLGFLKGENFENLFQNSKQRPAII
jgi:hypothetical protein